jgi:hypothetical protein
MTWLTTWLITYTHQEFEAVSLLLLHLHALDFFGEMLFNSMPVNIATKLKTSPQ